MEISKEQSSFFKKLWSQLSYPYSNNHTFTSIHHRCYCQEKVKASFKQHWSLKNHTMTECWHEADCKAKYISTNSEISCPAFQNMSHFTSTAEHWATGIHWVTWHLEMSGWKPFSNTNFEHTKCKRSFLKDTVCCCCFCLNLKLTLIVVSALQCLTSWKCWILEFCFMHFWFSLWV